MPQHTGAFGRGNRNVCHLSFLYYQINCRKQLPTELNCHFSSALQGQAVNVRWLSFSVEQELSGNCSVNTLGLFLPLCPHVPLKYS